MTSTDSPFSLRAPKFIALLGLIGLILTVISLFHYVALQNNLTLSSSFCHISDTLNCDKVNASQYSAFLGIPIASYGIFFYLLTILVACASLGGGLITLATAQGIFLVFGLVAVIVSITLFLISEFLIGALCPLCLAGYVVNFIILGIAWVAAYKTANPIALGIGSLLNSPRLLFAQSPTKNAAWIFTIAVLGAAYFSVSLPDVILTRVLIPSNYKNKMEEAAKEAVQAWAREPVIDLGLKVDGSALGDYGVGPASAPIQLVEFSDFECPFCRRFFFELEEFLKGYPNQVQFVLRNFPLDKACNPSMKVDMHQFACYSALFSRCAGEQGRFWEAAEYLFALPALDEPGTDTHDSIMSGVSALSLDGEAMRECMASKRQSDKIAQDITQAEKAGITGTPFLLVNGKKVKVPNIEVLKRIFDQALTTR